MTWSCSPGTFRVRGDTLEVIPAYQDRLGYRITFFGDEVERIIEFDPLTGEICAASSRQLDIYPAKHFITDEEKLKQAIADIEAGAGGAAGLLQGATTSCSKRSASSSAPATTWRCCARWATAPASRTTRATWTSAPPGTPPWTLMDYLPSDYLLVIDESHMTVPQIRGMYNGDRSRKADAGGIRFPPALRPGQPPADLR